MPRKVFTEQATTGDAVDPPVFVIEGKRRVVDDEGIESFEDWSAEFTALGVVPAGIIADFVACIAIDSQGRGIWPADALMTYLQRVVVEEDRARFTEFAHDTDTVVTAQVLHDIVMWLAPLQTGHPTTPPST